MTANFPARYRYTGAALTSDLAWLIGAGFAPLVALGLSAHFGLVLRQPLPAVGRGVLAGRAEPEPGAGDPGLIRCHP